MKISHRLRRLPPKHNEIVRSELVKMLDAGIVTHSVSGRSKLVSISYKKDGNPRFCAEYRSLNRVMKPEKWPLYRIEEIFDELSGGQRFTTLDLFSGHWKVMLEED